MTALRSSNGCRHSPDRLSDVEWLAEMTMKYRLFKKPNDRSKSVSAAIASFLSLVLLISVAMTPAAAEQCVSNKSGFHVKVEWYRSDLLLYEKDTLTPYLRPQAIPVHADVFPAYRGKCTTQTDADGRPLVAVLSAEGVRWGKRHVSIGSEAAAAIGSAIACADQLAQPVPQQLPA